MATTEGTRVAVTARVELLTPTITDLTVEFDRPSGRLRLATPDDQTVAVFSRGEVYRVAPEAPEGHIVIPEIDRIRDVASWLERQRVVAITRRYVDAYATTPSSVAIGRVLL